MSVIATKENCITKSNFNVLFFEKVDMLKEFKMLQPSKVTQ